MSEFDDIRREFDGCILPTYSRFPVALESGKGATAKGADGKTYIDFGSGIGVNVLGYADEGWCRAVSAQALKAAHISNLYYSPLQAELAKKLLSASGFGGVFFCNSGAEANEGLIKLARKYSFDKYGKGRSVVVTLENSFHGRTVTTLSATGQEGFHQYFFPFTEGFRFAKPNSFESLRQAAGQGDCCAVLLEAVQGEGGVYPLEPEFVKQAAAFAKQNDILLLFDEVQTGIGRTGRFFGFEHFGVKPDAVSCAKALAGGLPMGAVLCSKELSGVLGPGTHGSTFGGNLMACAGAMEVLGRVTESGFLKAVKGKGEYIRETLHKIPGIQGIRGFGLMIGFEAEGADSKAVSQRAAEEGLLILTAKKALRMLPPLVITREEIDRGMEILASAIEFVRNKGAAK